MCGATIKKVLALTVCLCMQAVVIAPVFGQTGNAPTREYEIKAAFLYHFARFIEWPEEAEQEQIALCVLGEDPFGKTLDDLEGKEVRSKTLTVRRLERGREAQRCHVLFISSSERERLPQLLDTLRTAHVLTVGETDTFAREGGAIRLFEARNKIRFEVNLEVARRAGLTVSSRMLKLADVIEEGP